MQIRLHIRRWVIWWFYVGVVCGALAIVNILGHHLAGAQDRLLILLGAAHWLLGGIVCWAFDGIRVQREERPQQQSAPQQVQPDHSLEFYPPSQFLLPGNRRSLLPWRH